MNQPSLFEDGAPAHEPPKARPGKAAPKAAPSLREPFAEPHTLPHGFAGFPARAAIAADLDAMPAGYAAREWSEDELLRHLRGSLYVLTVGELLALAKWLENTLRATDAALCAARMDPHQ